MSSVGPIRLSILIRGGGHSGKRINKNKELLTEFPLIPSSSPPSRRIIPVKIWNSPRGMTYSTFISIHFEGQEEINQSSDAPGIEILPGPGPTEHAAVARSTRRKILVIRN
jgi:hypothetical protein